ncbi:adenosine deaminase [Chlamydia sp. 17-3921]|uniref:adenosine deaminase n=1 Tax=Chlamydia sp. 17-3921 TaxID=2675798 RepID=UPI001F302868|nr:adenosine deaminase [Chlamydia sp. 17-3921]
MLTVRISKLLLEITKKLPLLHMQSCTDKIIQSLPKADIHVHLPGTITPQTAWELGVKHGFLKWGSSSWLDHRPLSSKNPHRNYSDIFLNFEDLRYKRLPDLNLLQYNISYRDFCSFDRVMATVQGHRFPPGGIQTEEDLLFILQNYLQQCLNENIFYTEVQQNIRLAHIIYPDLPPKIARYRFYQLLFQAKQLFEKHGITLHFLNCFNKTNFAGLNQTSNERSLEAALWLKESQENFPELFVGLQSAGTESCPGACPSQLVSGYMLACDNGFGCEAHAGEGTGFHYLQTTINELPVQRVAHGFQAIENPQTIEKIKNSQLTLVMSPIINLILGAAIYQYKNNIKIGKTLIQKIDDHPFFYLFRNQGIKIALSSDNPQMGGISLQKSMMLLAGIKPADTLFLPFEAAQQAPLQLNELILLIINSITSAFTSEEIKIRFLTRIEKFIDKLIQTSDQQMVDPSIRNTQG